MGINLNIGKPTGVCDNCGTSLVRYIRMEELESYQACPDCDDNTF